MKNLLIVLVALAFGISCMPASAVELTVGVLSHDLSVNALMSAYNAGTLETYLLQLVIDRIAGNPTMSMILIGLTASQPVLGFIANRTNNPLDNAFWIFINKVLQTLTFNSSTNQPDVLSWTQMLTNYPRDWPALLVIKAADETIYIRERIFK
ncbi:MAG: hypothetical protein V7785_21950 [Bermanella sp.]